MLVVFVIIFGVAGTSALLGYPLFAALGDVGLANTTVVAAGVCQVLLLVLFGQMGVRSGLSVALGVLGIETFILLARIWLALRLSARNGRNMGVL
jgi:hypothetical protein